MEFITSLIILFLLILPPFYLAGRELFMTVIPNRHGVPVSAGQPEEEPEWENSQVYDGMITVEIPVYDNQVVAYDPVFETDFAEELEIIIPPSQASRA